MSIKWVDFAYGISRVVWVIALFFMVGAVFDLRNAFFGNENLSAIQQAAGGVLAVGEGILPYVIARAIDHILKPTVVLVAQAPEKNTANNIAMG